MLDRPASEDELYLARAGDVDPYRPICQGDIFDQVDIPGLSACPAAMVIAHPCVMRAGPRLRAKVTVIPVVTYERVPLERWPTHHLRVFPLPGLDPSHPEQGYAARFDEFGTVEAGALQLEHRIAMLSELGVLLLQQRFVHSLTRAEIPVIRLREASAAVFEELELQENWNLAFARPRVETGQPLGEVLAAEAEAFDQVMLTSPQGASLRDLLQMPEARAEVRRAVNRAIRDRRAGEG